MVDFFFNDTATTEIYTLSLTRRSSDLQLEYPAQALPGILVGDVVGELRRHGPRLDYRHPDAVFEERSEEHTSELQSRQYLVCRLLLEKKNKIAIAIPFVNANLRLGPRL